MILGLFICLICLVGFLNPQIHSIEDHHEEPQTQAEEVSSG